MKKFLGIIILVLFVLFGFSMVISCSKSKADDGAEGKKIKAGFVYVGPVGDYGWSNAHDVGRKYVEEKFPWLETLIMESVSEADSARIIDRFIQEEKCDIVFTTSFGYMDDTIKAGEKYPDKKFMHCSGFKRSANVGTYFADLYQIYYLNGLMAGALTESNKIGYVGAFPISEVIRHIDAFALGVKEANPEAELHVKWINAWVGPAEAREAAESLIAEGCDALAFTEDTPAVVEVGQEHFEKGDKVYTFSHYSPMQDYGKDSAVSGQLVDWGIMYEKILGDFYEGKWNEDLLWLLKEGAVALGAKPGEEINKAHVDKLKSIEISSKDYGKTNIYDLVMKRKEAMIKGEFDPFTGPVKDNKGKVQIKNGEKASIPDLMSIMYYVDNVVGDIPQ